MILTQPSLTRAEWTGEVTKMMPTYKAPVSDDDAAQIVTYLVGLKVAPVDAAKGISRAVVRVGNNPVLLADVPDRAA